MIRTDEGPEKDVEEGVEEDVAEDVEGSADKAVGLADGLDDGLDDCLDDGFVDGLDDGLVDGLDTDVKVVVPDDAGLSRGNETRDLVLWAMYSVDGEDSHDVEDEGTEEDADVYSEDEDE